MYLPFFSPDLPGQLVTSLPDDNIKKILYHAMPNMWEKKMVEQGYNYLDGPIHPMVEIFETRIKNLEKSIPSSDPSRNNNRIKKGSKKRKSVTFDEADDEDSDEGHTRKKILRYHGYCGHTSD